MIDRTKLLLVLLPSLALLLGLPASAPGKTVTYKGKIGKGVPDIEGKRSSGGGTVEFRVEFKGKPKRGKPLRVGYVQVRQPPWECEPGSTGHMRPQNQRIRFGEWAPGGVFDRVDRAGQFWVAGDGIVNGLFRDHSFYGEFQGKGAKKAGGDLRLEFGSPAPIPGDPDYPGNTDEYSCTVEHEWTAKRQ